MTANAEGANSTPDQPEAVVGNQAAENQGADSQAADRQAAATPQMSREATHPAESPVAAESPVGAQPSPSPESAPEAAVYQPGGTRPGAEPASVRQPAPQDAETQPTAPLPPAHESQYLYQGQVPYTQDAAQVSEPTRGEQNPNPQGASSSQPGVPQPASSQSGVPQQGPDSQQSAFGTLPVPPQSRNPGGSYGPGGHGPGSNRPGGNGPKSNGPATTGQPQPPRRRSALAIVGALAVGALVGGAAGGGIVGMYALNQNGAAITNAEGARSSITINPNSATVVSAVAQKASPSVVTILVAGNNTGGTGSGIILSADGYVLTNTHVVTLDGEISDPSIQVSDNSGSLYSAKLVGTDPLSDLAVIKLQDASGLSPAVFADSNELNVGDAAIAIGAPLGLSGTVTNGIISALNRSITIASSAAPSTPNGDQGEDSGESPFNFWNLPLPGNPDTPQQQPQAQSATISIPVIQTDAAINPGNSGGPLLDAQGQVIGVNVAIASAGGNSTGIQAGNIGVGFAVPSHLAQRVANELIDTGKASHGLLGASITNAVRSGNSNVLGAEIKELTPGGAAEKAGLKVGDVVTEFDGHPITDMSDLTAQVRVLPGGATADLGYVRLGKAATVSVTLDELTQ